MKTLIFLLSGFVIFCNSIAYSHAQGEEGTLRGFVYETISGEAVPFADIIIKNSTQEIVAGGISTIDGMYHINPLPAGTYTVEGSCIGLSTEVYQEIEIRPGKITTFNILLLEESIRLPECVIIVDQPLISSCRTICYFPGACCGCVSSIPVRHLSENEIKVETFEMYPNPSSGALNINTDDEIEKVLITNMNGQQVAELRPNIAGEISANLGHLPPATYVVHYTTGVGRISKLWTLAH